jgi:hypothetical protein
LAVGFTPATLPEVAPPVAKPSLLGACVQDVEFWQVQFTVTVLPSTIVDGDAVNTEHEGDGITVVLPPPDCPPPFVEHATDGDVAPFASVAVTDAE